MKAYLKNYRQAPRKVRVVSDLIKNKSVLEALAQLAVLPKKASAPIQKLLKSAISNAKNSGEEDTSSLFIKQIKVDKGLVLKRSLPTARGRATQVHKHASHITLELGIRNRELRSHK
ncbi:MAG TPA: 50S ribosomal protein L22 [Candidatus Paceibacterota bacterium]